MDFKKRMDELIDKGISASRDLWGKAKDTARDLSQKGILTYEISQLERQAHAELARLGSLVYEALVTGQQSSVAADDPAVKGSVEKVQELRAKIETREEELKKLRQ